MPLQMSEEEFAGLGVDGGSLGVAVGSIVIDVSGVRNAEAVVADSSQKMTADLETVGASGESFQQLEGWTGKLNDQFITAASSVDKLSINLRGLSAAGRVLSTVGLPGGQELRFAASAIRTQKFLDQLSPLMDKFANSLQNTVGLTGQVSTAAAGMAGSLGAVLTVAVPVAAAVAILAIGISKFQEGIREGEKTLDAAYTRVDAYYKAIETGTTESLQKELEGLRVHEKIEQAKLDLVKTSGAQALQAEIQNRGLYVAGIESLFGAFKPAVDKTNEYQKALDDTKATISALEDATKSDQVATNDAAEAERNLAAERRKSVTEGVAKQVQLEELARTGSSKQVLDEIERRKEEARAIEDYLPILQAHIGDSKEDAAAYTELVAKMHDDNDAVNQLQGDILNMVLAREREAEAAKKAAEDVKKAADEITKANEASAKAYEGYQKDIAKIDEDGIKERISIQQKLNDAIVNAAKQAADDAKQALNKLTNTESDDYTKLLQDNAKQGREAVDQQKALQVKATREERDLWVDHYQKLQDIQKSNDSKDEQDLLNRNFVGILERKKQTTEQLTAESTRYTQEKAQKEQALRDQAQDEQTHRDIQARERQISYLEAIADAKVQYQRELVVARQKRDEAVALAKSEAIQSVAALKSKIAEEKAARYNQAVDEIKLANQTADARMKLLVAERDAALKMAYGVTPQKTAATGAASGGGGRGATRLVATRASGGQLNAGEWSRVQEGKNAETWNGIPFPSEGEGLFFPMNGGTVTPQSRRGGGSSKHATVNVYGSNLNAQAVADIVNTHLDNLLGD